jgi:adenylate cyclase
MDDLREAKAQEVTSAIDVVPDVLVSSPLLSSLSVPAAGRLSSHVPFVKRFAVRLAVYLALMMLILIVATGYYVYQKMYQTQLKQIQANLSMLVTTLALSVDGQAIAAIAIDNTEQLPLHQHIYQQFARIAATDANVFSLYILKPTQQPTQLRFFVDYAKQGKQAQIGEIYDASELPIMLQGLARLSVENEPYADDFGLSLSAYMPLRTTDGQTIALLGADVMAEQLNFLRHQIARGVAEIFGLVLLSVMVFALWLGRWVRKPLYQIIEATQQIAEGEWQQRLNWQRSDEFGVLGGHFDRMADELRDQNIIRDTFGRYVSHKVVANLLKERCLPVLGGEERIVTILFADLQGYTTLSEYLPPPQTLALLNEFFGAMNELIDLNQGCLIEFLGDGLLAVFGAPTYDANHAEAAVSCALEMQQRLLALNHQWQQQGIAQAWQEAGVDQLKIRIGIHSGSVIAGNLGSRSRMKYGVIGDAVNIASRLEALNKPLGTSMLISDAVKQRLSPTLQARFRCTGEQAIRGRAQPVKAYALTA